MKSEWHIEGVGIPDRAGIGSTDRVRHESPGHLA